MTRRGHDPRDKGPQQSSSPTSTLPRSLHTDEGAHGPTFRRQATLSPPDSAAGEPAHQARSSRFLRRSRSKQQVRDSGNDTNSSEGLPPRSHASSPGTLEASSSSVKSPPVAAERSPSPALPSIASRTFGLASPPPSRGGDTTPASQALRAGSTDSSRAGGHWFSSMLGASQNAQAQRQNDDAASVRSFSTTATSPSRFLRRGQHESPGRKSSAATSATASDAPRPSVDNSKPAVTRMGGFDRMFDRAMQYFTDSDSNADKDPSDIWLLGVRHNGWRSDRNLADSGTLVDQAIRSSFDTITGELDPSTSRYSKATTSRQTSGQRLSKSVPNRPASSDSGSSSGMAAPSSPSPSKTKRLFTRKGQNSDLRPAHSTSVPAQTMHSLPLGRATSESGTSSQSDEVSRDPSQGSFSANVENGVLRSPSNLYQPVSPTQTYGWPPAFYHDFYSRIQLTYRSGFLALPASSSSSSAASSSNTVTSAFTSMISNLGASMGRNAAIGNQSASNAATGLTTDTGWGCMLRTGQSLLANTLMDVHLGRNFRRPLPRDDVQPLSAPDFFSSTPIYPRYIRLTSWFLDDPSPDAPFSIHKFVNEGKRLGKQVGEWFGPSTAAGAIAALANDYAPANLGVAQAIDTTVYGSEVSQVARGNAAYGWNRPVLILVPLRLGLNGVNPIYFSSIQHYFTLPQCVGIAGGRPSSSYYFVGTQGIQLFYIDPHHTKPTVKKVPIPEQLSQLSAHQPLSSALEPAGDPQHQLDNLDIFFANAYGTRDLESFHCEKVRKMSLAALDPSMLVGLLCKSRADWDDLCRRMKSFPASKEHHPLINIVQEMPAWMRNPSRTISGAGLNTSVSKKAVPSTVAEGAGTGQFTGEGRQTRPRDESMISNAEELEGNSVDYADSDDWDIDDSDDSHSEGNSTRESIVVHDTRDETDAPSNNISRQEPSHQAVRGSIRFVTKKPTTTPSSSLPDDFERINVDSLSVSPRSPSERLDNEPVVVLQSSSLPSAQSNPASANVQQGRQMSLEAEDRAAGWEACTTAPQPSHPKCQQTFR